LLLGFFFLFLDGLSFGLGICLVLFLSSLRGIGLRLRGGAASGAYSSINASM